MKNLLPKKSSAPLEYGDAGFHGSKYWPGFEETKEAGLEEDTLVIFLSDNGGHEESQPAFAGRRQPFGRWDSGAILPKWPSRLEAGQVYRNPVIPLICSPPWFRPRGKY